MVLLTSSVCPIKKLDFRDIHGMLCVVWDIKLFFKENYFTGLVIVGKSIIVCNRTWRSSAYNCDWKWLRHTECSYYISGTRATTLSNEASAGSASRTPNPYSSVHMCTRLITLTGVYAPSGLISTHKYSSALASFVSNVTAQGLPHGIPATQKA